MEGPLTWLLIITVYTLGHVHGSIRQRRRMERRVERSADWAEQTVADALYGSGKSPDALTKHKEVFYRNG